MSETSRFKITADDVRAYDWQSPIAAASDKLCSLYSSAYADLSRKLKEQGDERGDRVFWFLSVVCSFHPNYDKKGNPYGPFWTEGNKRALMAEDLVSEDLDVLAAILPDAHDPELRARIADVLWECRKDHRSAQIAIEAYLETGEVTAPEDIWAPFGERLERALQLAAKIGFGNDKHREIVAIVEDLIVKFQPDLKAGLSCARLMRLLIVHRAGDPGKYAAISESLAQSYRDLGDFRFARRYYELGALWQRKAKEPDKANNLLLAAAETRVSEADAYVTGEHKNYSAAAQCLSEAVRSMRDAGGSKERIDDLHRKLTELQKLSLVEFQTSSIDMEAIPDFTEGRKAAIQASVESVSGLPFDKAVFHLASMFDPVDPSELRKKTENLIAEYPLPYLFGSIAVSSSGKQTATAPSVAVGPDDEKEKAMQKEMLEQARVIHWPLLVDFYIEPTRIQIVKEHGIRLSDLSFLVSHNPFIPQGHEGLFARGIQAGFEGDWAVSMHLLIPQIENSIRWVLERNGEIVSTLEQDGTQKERDLGWLLTCDKMKEIFGERLTFSLRGLLIEKFGHNFRNIVAHGLVDEGGFFSHVSVHIWWLAIRLCAAPLIMKK